jgi:hypothetical protein
MGALIAYDRAGNVFAWMDHLAIEDTDGVVRAVDFVGCEREGVRLRTLWLVSGASGSTTWPEYLGDRFSEFRVELDARAPLRGRRLVHRGSGHVRDRESIELDIDRRKQAQRRSGRRTLDVRTFLGSPVRALSLDDDGRTRTDADAHPEGRALVMHGSPHSTTREPSASTSLPTVSTRTVSVPGSDRS